MRQRIAIGGQVLACVPLSWMDRILAKEMMAMKVREVENVDRRKDIYLRGVLSLFWLVSRGRLLLY